jgi:chromosome condensin MukBEF complex kleisin-like MukF subunit
MDAEEFSCWVSYKNKIDKVVSSTIPVMKIIREYSNRLEDSIQARFTLGWPI